MKIVLVNSLYAPRVLGGAERAVQALAEKLLAAGHEPVVVSLQPEQSASEARVNGVRVHYVGLRNVYWPFPAGARPAALKPLWHVIDSRNTAMSGSVRKIVRAERPDVVHTNALFGFSTHVWPVVARLGIPLVHTLHDYYLLCPKATMFRNGRNCARQHFDCSLLSYPRARDARHVHAISSVSRFLLDRHLKHGALAGVPLRKVIYNMVEPAGQAQSRSRPGEPLRIGYLGQLLPTKGIERLLDAVVALPRGSWELCVGGSGSPEYEQELQARAAGTATRFIGFVDPATLLTQVDVLVVPSLYNEPMGMVVLEALAHGVPVAGSRRGGIPELIDPGRTGFLFDPDEPGALQRVLERFLHDPALSEAMRQACIERAESFKPARIVSEYLELYAAAIDASESAHARLRPADSPGETLSQPG